MEIKKGQLLRIQHRRKGIFVAKALQDFDSEKVLWFPVVLAEGHVRGVALGLAPDWVPGNEIPCRASLVRTLEVL